MIHGVSKHHALALTGCSAGIEYIGQFVERCAVLAAIHFILMGKTFPDDQELVEIKRKVVLRILHDSTVENHDSLQCIANRIDTKSRIVLFLFAYKEETDGSVVYHILDLCIAAGGIEGNRDSAYAVCTEVYKKTFGLVLRKYADVFLNFYAPCYQCVRHGLHGPGKTVPRDGDPCVFLIITIRKRRTVSVLTGLFLN